MTERARTIRDELLTILREIRDDWDTPAGEIDEGTGLFRDLGFESVDAVALGSALEHRFNQTLPFAEFLTDARERQVEDITVGQLLTFLTTNVQAGQAKGQAV